MNKERLQEDDEVLVRDVKLDEPFFLPEKEAEREEKAGNVVIVKEKPNDSTK